MNEMHLNGLVEDTRSGRRATLDARCGGMAERLTGPFRAQMEAQVSERVTNSYRRHGLDVADADHTLTMARPAHRACDLPPASGTAGNDYAAHESNSEHEECPWRASPEKSRS